MPVVPIVGVAFSIWLLTELDVITWIRFAAWLVIGLVIYFSYGRKRSRLALARQAENG
jgi:APA family basic amino acid/polyamine antiporter